VQQHSRPYRATTQQALPYNNTSVLTVKQHSSPHKYLTINNNSKLICDLDEPTPSNIYLYSRDTLYMCTVFFSGGLVAVSKPSQLVHKAQYYFFETGRIGSENGLVLTSDTPSTDTVYERG
jgi:hypothetical protein